MLLITFLEFCVGEIDLWPAYIIDLLFVKDYTPQNICKVAAFLYGNGVPLKVASRLYTLCNPSRASTHIIPYVMGGYYSTFHSRCNVLHMEHNYNVSRGRLMWLNGRSQSQTEQVRISQLVPPYYDCRTLLGCYVAANIDHVMYTTMLQLCDVEAFDIKDL
jgi:hypothetical protein